MLQSRAANAIQQMNLTELPPKFLFALIEAVKVGTNLERTARDLKQSKPHAAPVTQNRRRTRRSI